MKKVTKKVLAVVLLGIMVFSLTACGLDMSKVKGEWTLSTVNGKAIDEYASQLEANGIPTFTAFINYEITDKKFKAISLDGSGNEQSSEYDIKVKSNGFECMTGDTILMSVLYDDKASTLSYKVKVGDQELEYKLVKGKTDLQAKVQAAYAGGDEESYDEGDGEVEE